MREERVVKKAYCELQDGITTAREEEEEMQLTWIPGDESCYKAPTLTL